MESIIGTKTSYHKNTQTANTRASRTAVERMYHQNKSVSLRLVSEEAAVLGILTSIVLFR